MKVLVYDANNFLYVAGAGQDSHVGMASMFVRAVTAISANMKADNFVFLWDGGIAAWRRDLIPGYKIRPTKDPDAAEMIRKAKKLTMAVLDFLGTSQIRVDGAEADDLISVLVHEVVAARTDMEVVIVSTDKDFYQMVGPRISVYNPVKKRTVNEKSFKDVVGGISRLEFMAYRAMVGDASDKIPGVRGIGDKKAGVVLDEVEKRISGGSQRPFFAEVMNVLENDASKDEFKVALKTMRLPRKIDELDDIASGSLKRVIESAEPRKKRFHVNETKFMDLVSKLGLDGMYGEMLFEFMGAWRIMLV